MAEHALDPADRAPQPDANEDAFRSGSGEGGFGKPPGALRETLKESVIRTEAAELMDQLIESVTIYPDGANGPEAEVVAKVADLAVYALNDNTAPGRS